MSSIEVWEDTFRVNNRRSEDQDQPDIVGLSNGNFLVVWRDDNDTTANGFGSDIMGQSYDPRGNEIGGEIFLNETDGFVFNEGQPSIAATNDGGFVVTYSFFQSSQSDYLFIRYDADLVLQQDIYALNENDVDVSYSDLEVVHRPDGTSVVTYRRDEFADEDIVFNTISAGGTRGAEREVRSDDDPGGAINGDPDNPRAAVLTDGRVVVAFVEEDANIRGVEFRIINANDTLGLNQQITQPNGGETNAEVAALANGGFVITYLRDNVVYGQTFNGDASGSARSGEVALFAGSDTKTEPKVIGLKEGGYAVAFLDQSDGEVSVRAFDVNGAPKGSKVDVPFEGGDTDELEMSLTTDGRILIVWTNSDGGNEDVFSAILDPRSGTINVGDGTVTVASQSGSIIRGSDADDVFYGARGDDTLVGREGEDLLTGGLGKDKLDGGKNADLIFGKAGADQIFGGKGGDDIFGGSGADKVYGGDWHDDIEGGRGNDTLLGEEGNDDIAGGSGNDNVNGGKGRDELAGGTGNDRMIGGRGTDEMRGGSGADSFIFRDAIDSRAGSQNRDTIEDFRTGIDTIDLGGVDANSRLGGNQAFDFIGAAGFSRDAGELRVQVNGDNAVIQGDRDGNGVSDFEIRLEDFGGINTFDFIL